MAPGIDSTVERNLIMHNFFGNGKDFYLTNAETARYAQNPTSSDFNYGIGQPNPGPNDRIDVYDFDNKPWFGPESRGIPNEFSNRGVGFISDIFGGKAFNIYGASAQCR